MQANITFPGSNAVLQTEICSVYLCLDPPHCSYGYVPGGNIPTGASVLDVSQLSLTAEFTRGAHACRVCGSHMHACYRGDVLLIVIVTVVHCADPLALLPFWFNDTLEVGSITSNQWTITNGTGHIRTLSTRTLIPHWVSASLQAVYG